MRRHGTSSIVIAEITHANHGVFSMNPTVQPDGVSHQQYQAVVAKHTVCIYANIATGNVIALQRTIVAEVDFTGSHCDLVSIDEVTA
ncbi:hypothetical protein D3C75_1068810 [compost metagenome]